MVAADYLDIVSHYESCLKEHGDTHRGVDWPNQDDAFKRYEVMLELLPPGVKEARLLDFGCGAAHLLEYMHSRRIEGIEYVGLDLSSKFISLCREKFPQTSFLHCDILSQDEKLPTFDYVIMNGVFTEKRDLSFDAMWKYFQNVISAVFNKTEIGFAFNVMSKHVDWERNDLFHLPFDMLAQFLCSKISRKFVFRNDYGLYEYTAYVYR